MKKKKFCLLILSSIMMTTLFSCSNNQENPPIGEIDYGTLSIKDYELTFMQEIIINPVFSFEQYEESLTYSFEGNNISIKNGKIKGLVPGTITTVKASSEHFNTTFNVKVNYINAILTNDKGDESKFSVPIPEEDNYLLHLDVNVPVYVTNFTRLSSFAFNGSNNSWYNVEMHDDGNIYLYAKFNNIEKYNILLGHKDNLSKDGIINYKVKIFKKGQATRFYFNDKLMCSFDELEMEGYPRLSSFEVTAAANRENAGKYIVNLNNVYYEDENSENYKKLLDMIDLIIEDMTLKNKDGAESKFSYGDISQYFDSYLYSTTIEIIKYDINRTRPCAFAFNGSDNSWYNIEMDAKGDLYLFVRFNNIEKYNIYLDNKNNLLKDNKISFDIDILKDKNSTYFFFNESLMCWFTNKQLEGYSNLDTLEITSCTDVWQDGLEYEVNVINTTFKSKETDIYKEYQNKIYKEYDDVTLKSENGDETKAPIIVASDKILYSTTVKVKKDSSGWFRPSAFAFNNSDNSWYNIETDINGKLILYARFNNIEKYNIDLGNKEDFIIDGFLQYDVSILKNNQATYFFFNDELKAHFNEEEMKNYPGMDGIHITSCANRAQSSYEVEFINQISEDENSLNYKNYLEKTEGINDEK